jgi:hypothetical protein
MSCTVYKEDYFVHNGGTNPAYPLNPYTSYTLFPENLTSVHGLKKEMTLKKMKLNYINNNFLLIAYLPSAMIQSYSKLHILHCVSL